MNTDTLANVITKIRNAQRASKKSVRVPCSTNVKDVLTVLKAEGFIESFTDTTSEAGFAELEVTLRYDNGDPLIRSIDRVSTPGQRVYKGKDDLGRITSGLGISIISTSQGVITDREAQKRGIGGEVLVRVG